MAQVNAESGNEKIVEYGPYGSQDPTNYRIQLKNGEKITEVLIGHGWNVDAIGFSIVRPDGDVVIKMTGQSGQNLSKIVLKEGETVTGFSGSFGHKDGDSYTAIATLYVHTNKYLHGYGPYGEGKGVSGVCSFTSPANPDFVGIFGKAGLYLESIGPLYKED